jgi:hypothetical protein
VEAECYRAIVAARIPAADGRIASIANLLHSISFNFGPTLLAWMETHAPETYHSVLNADRESRKRTGGYGNALAQAYHHTILPLASRREKVTEVRWGIADFRRRFRRDPDGMWLPETAVDAETLDVLAQEGIAFTIVAPHQLRKVPRGGLPGRFRTGGGRSIAIFPYDGPLSHGVAFGSLLTDAEIWAKAMVDSSLHEDIASLDVNERNPGRYEFDQPPNRLVSIATDGETYGHHHRFGEMALAAVLAILSLKKGVRVENFSSFLARIPPLEDVALEEPSSWSCAHGVERWRGNCGCKMFLAVATQQEWRKPLREAMEWLATRFHAIYEEEGAALLGDPWAALDGLGEAGPSDPAAATEVLRNFAPRELTESEIVRARDLLELERNALQLFTSCGWFFDDLAGIEPIQVLRYAARALELVGPRSRELTEGFLTILQEARSNETPPRDGRAVFLEEARPSKPVVSGVAGQTPEGGAKEEGQTAEEPGEALISEIRGLDPNGAPDTLSSAIESILALAELTSHDGDPIPFDAQTQFYRILQDAPAPQAALLSVLREPLGFVRSS